MKLRGKTPSNFTLYTLHIRRDTKSAQALEGAKTLGLASYNYGQKKALYCL